MNFKFIEEIAGCLDCFMQGLSECGVVHNFTIQFLSNPRTDEAFRRALLVQLRDHISVVQALLYQLQKPDEIVCHSGVQANLCSCSCVKVVSSPVVLGTECVETSGDIGDAPFRIASVETLRTPLPPSPVHSSSDSDRGRREYDLNSDVDMLNNNEVSFVEHSNLHHSENICDSNDHFPSVTSDDLKVKILGENQEIVHFSSDALKMNHVSSGELDCSLKDEFDPKPEYCDLKCDFVKPDDDLDDLFRGSSYAKSEMRDFKDMDIKPDTSFGNCPQENIANATLMRSILNSLDEIKYTVNTNNQLLQMTLSQSGSKGVATQFNLPLSSHADIVASESLLKNKAKKSYLIAKLSAIGGESIAFAVDRILCTLLTDDVASRYNYLGKKGKESFKSLKLHEIIIKSIQNSQPFAKEYEIEELIKRWLKRASWRLRRQQNKLPCPS